jgi:hypothetical protein
MNVQLALEALEDAKAHPGNFDMNLYFSRGWNGFVKDSDSTEPPCGSTACYAGFVALRAAPVGSKIADGYIVHPDGKTAFADHYAADALDITWSQGNAVFNLNDIGEVEDAVRYLADNPDISGSQLWEMFFNPGSDL